MNLDLKIPNNDMDIKQISNSEKYCDDQLEQTFDPIFYDITKYSANSNILLIDSNVQDYQIFFNKGQIRKC